MWVCLTDCFLSIVHKDCADDELLVRARRKGDIEKVFPDANVRETLGNDYRYRAVVSREAVSAAMAAEVSRITYDNFKNNVDDHDLHNAYASVWGVIGRLQPGGPYSRGGRAYRGQGALL